jgi:aspartyl-tRNA(Asn)/glutamyl-tRNA(Gln) amidotransferase subunit A
MYLADIYTVPINLAGIPALSMPCGVDKNGLPIGLQIIGKHFDEKNIIKAGLIYEKYANN